MASPIGEGIERLAATLAVWKLRHLSHELSAANDWSKPFLRAVRDGYDTAGRTPQEIAEQVRLSWGDLIN
jgi:hypothetical protein